MMKLEADIKKKTINNFVLLLEKLQDLTIPNIKFIASNICDSIDKEVEKEDEFPFTKF